MVFNDAMFAPKMGLLALVYAHIFGILSGNVSNRSYLKGYRQPLTFFASLNWKTLKVHAHGEVNWGETSKKGVFHGSALFTAAKHQPDEKPDPSPLLSSVRGFLQDHCGFQPRGQGGIIVCVSGGSDSLALLEILYQLKKTDTSEFLLEAIHFNHQLRPESDEEALFVKQYCQERSIPFHERCWSEEVLPEAVSSDDKLLGSGPGSAVQARAREWRRRESLKLREYLLHQHSLIKDIRVATAHHSGDQEETMLLQLLRGVHISGLQGMSSTLPFPFIKPLISFSKEELVNFLLSHGLEWMEDESNKSRKYKRNQVRLDLVPMLQDLAGGASAFSARMNEVAEQSSMVQHHLEMEVTRWNKEYQSQCSENEFMLHSDWWSLTELIQHELIHDFITKCTQTSMPFKQLKKIVAQVHNGESQWTLYIGQDWILTRIGDMLSLEQKGSKMTLPQNIEEECGDLKITFPKEWVFTAERINHDSKVVLCSKKDNSSFPVILYNVPYGANLSLRFRKDGDRFHPPWRQTPMKLKDYLRGQKIPLHKRDRMPLICVQDKVAAVCTIERSIEFSEDTTDFLPVLVNFRKEVVTKHKTKR